MLEIYIDERGEAAIENISSLMKAFPQHAKRATASALKSEGFRLKNLIQTAIRNGGIDGEWEELNPHTGVLSRMRDKSGRYKHVKNFRMVWKGKKGSKRRVAQYKSVMISKRKNPLSKLAGAVRYKYDKDVEMVNIGFIQSAGISMNFLKLAGMHAKGFETRVTPHMRKMLFSLGFPIKKTTTKLTTPARPAVEPVFKQEKQYMMKNIEIKFMKALERYWSKRDNRRTA